MNYGCTGIKTFELRLESRHYRSLVSSTSIYESKLGLEASSTTDDTNITSAFSSVPSDDIGIGWRYFTPIEALVIRAKFICAISTCQLDDPIWSPDEMGVNWTRLSKVNFSL